MDKQTKINNEVEKALYLVMELILDLSWATSGLQDKSGWKNVHRELSDVIYRIRNLNIGR